MPFYRLSSLRLSGEQIFAIATGVSITLTQFSGAVQVAIYLVFGIPPIFGIPLFGLAAVLGAVAVVRSAGDIILSRAFVFCIGSWLLYVLWVTISAAWSTSLVVVGDKEMEMVVFSTAFFLMGIAAGRSIIILKAFMASVVFSSFVMLMAMGLAASRGASLGRLAMQVDALKLFAEAYQSITACLGTAAIFALVVVLQRSVRGRIAGLWITAWAILSLATLAGGGRGAALGCALAQAFVLVFALVTKREDIKKKLAWALLVLLPAGLAAGFVIALQLHLQTAIRLVRSLSSSADTTGRGDLWGRAIDMAEQHMVFGAGLGSYEASANLIEDGGTYPHNLFLETLAETGIIGFLLFCTAIVAAIVGVLARVGRLSFFQAAIWLGFVVETMVEISVSSTITDHFLAFSLGLSAGLIALADRMRAAAAPVSL